MTEISLDELLAEYGKVTKPKGKYWYRTYIVGCPVCGAETRFRERVYKEEERGIKYNNSLCDYCWMS